MQFDTQLATSRPAISIAERARREAEVAFARGSVHYEGGILPAVIEHLNARYVAGEIDSEELTTAILTANPRQGS